jgi:hypothetical protein
MAKKPDKREVCEKLFAHRIKHRQGLQRNQWAVDNAVKGAIARSQGYAGLSKLANTSAPGEQSPRKSPAPKCRAQGAGRRCRSTGLFAAGSAWAISAGRRCERGLRNAFWV